MKKSFLLIPIVLVTLIITAIYLFPKYEISDGKIRTVKEKVEISYTCAIDSFDSYTELKSGLYIGSGNHDLSIMSETLGCDLSREFKKYEEYKNNHFTYFVEVYSTTSTNKYLKPSDFYISKNDAYFIYDGTKDFDAEDSSNEISITPCVDIPSKISVAAVPNDLLKEDGTVTTDNFITDDGREWHRITTNKAIISED